MFSGSSPLASRSDAVSLKPDPLTGLMVDKQSANEICPSELVAPTKNVPGTPLVLVSQMCCGTFVACPRLVGHPS